MPSPVFLPLRARDLRAGTARGQVPARSERDRLLRASHPPEVLARIAGRTGPSNRPARRCRRPRGTDGQPHLGAVRRGDRVGRGTGFPPISGALAGGQVEVDRGSREGGVPGSAPPAGRRGEDRGGRKKPIGRGFDADLLGRWYELVLEWPPADGSESLAESFRHTLQVLVDMAARGSFPLNDDGPCRICEYAPACRKSHPPSVERVRSAPA